MFIIVFLWFFITPFSSCSLWIMKKTYKDDVIKGFVITTFFLIFFFQFSMLITVFICMLVCVCMCRVAHKRRYRISYGSQFYLSTMWVPGNKLRSPCNGWNHYILSHLTRPLTVSSILFWVGPIWAIDILEGRLFWRWAWGSPLCFCWFEWKSKKPCALWTRLTQSEVSLEIVD